MRCRVDILGMVDETIKINIRNEDGDSENYSFQSEIQWQIEDGPTKPANSQWLWALAIIGFSIIIFAVILKNYLLAVIVFLSAFIVYAGKFKKTEIHDFRLDGEGIVIDEKLYSYENFESFWIFTNEEIAFRRKQRLMPLLIVPFNGNKELEIRKILESHLPENEEEESFLDLLRKKLF